MGFPDLFEFGELGDCSVFPYFNQRYGIWSSNGLAISHNQFVEMISVPKAEDCAIPFRISVFAFTDPNIFNHEIYSGRVKVLEPTTIGYDLDERIFTDVYGRLKALPEDWFEIWPADHNVREGFHFPDPWGETTELLAHVESRLEIIKPPVNHNKVSSRKINKYDCTELHLDSFEGMRCNSIGKRQRIFRHFLNFGLEPRTTLISPGDIEFVDKFVGPDYRQDYLDPIVNACRGNLPVIRLTLPPRDPRTKKVYGYKILTTHLVHGEYGPKDDFLAIINSME